MTSRLSLSSSPPPPLHAQGDRRPPYRRRTVQSTTIKGSRQGRRRRGWALSQADVSPPCLLCVARVQYSCRALFCCFFSVGSAACYCHSHRVRKLSFFFFPSQLVLPPAAVPDLVGQGERGGCLAHGWTARRSHGESRRCGCAVAAAAATATAAAVARCGLGGPAGTRRRAGRVAAGGGGTRPPWGHLSRSGHPTRAYPPPPSTITAAAHRRRPPSCVTCTITGGRTQWSASSPQRRWLLLFSVVVRLCSPPPTPS